MCGINTSPRYGNNRITHHDGSQTAPYPADVEESIKRMYARGDIDRQAFRRLLTLAAQGEIHQNDLPMISQRLQTTNSVNSPELQALTRQASHLRDKVRQAAEAALRAKTSIEAEAQLEIQQGALFRLRDVEAQIANYQTE